MLRYRTFGSRTYAGPTQAVRRAEPVWRSSGGGNVSVLADHDEQLVLAVPREPVTAIEPSGRVRWTLPSEVRLPDGSKTVSVADDRAVPVLLDARSGTELWRAGEHGPWVDSFERQVNKPTAHRGLVLSVSSGRPT